MANTMGKQPINQRDQRRDLNPHDQFGRMWLAQIEKETMDLCGIVHAAGWQDPLRTPQKYLGVGEDEYSQRNPMILKVKAVEWIRDIEDAEGEWTRQLYSIGRTVSKHNFNPKTAHEDEYLLEVVGPKPWPSSETLKRAFNLKDPISRVLLGFHPMKVNGKPVMGDKLVKEARVLLDQEEIEDLEAAANSVKTDGDVTNKDGNAAAVPMKYQQFVKQCFAEGKVRVMGEVGPLWAAYKEGLKGE